MTANLMPEGFLRNADEHTETKWMVGYRRCGEQRTKIPERLAVSSTWTIFASIPSTFTRGLTFCLGYISIAALVLGITKVLSLYYGFATLWVLGSLGGFLFIGFAALAIFRIYMTRGAKGAKGTYQKIFAHFIEIQKVAGNASIAVRCVHSAGKEGANIEPSVRQELDDWWGKAKETLKNLPAGADPPDLQPRDLKITLEETAKYLDDLSKDMGELIKIL